MMGGLRVRGDGKTVNMGAYPRPSKLKSEFAKSEINAIHLTSALSPTTDGAAGSARRHRGSQAEVGAAGGRGRRHPRGRNSEGATTLRGGWSGCWSGCGRRYTTHACPLGPTPYSRTGRGVSGERLVNIDKDSRILHVIVSG